MTMDDTPTPDTPQAATGSRAWTNIRARHVADGRLDGDGVAALIAEMRRQNRHEHPEWVKGYDTAVTEYEPVITDLQFGLLLLSIVSVAVTLVTWNGLWVLGVLPFTVYVTVTFLATSRGEE